MRKHLIPIAWMLVVGCSSCSNEATMEEPKPKPDPVPQLSFVSAPCESASEDVKLSQNESTLIVCGLRGKISLYDAQSLTLLTTFDLKEKYNVTSNCRMSVIGDNAYVIYGADQDPPMIVKVDLVQKKLVDEWKIPAELFNRSVFGGIDLKAYYGLLPLEEPGQAVLAHYFTIDYSGDPRNDKEERGIAPIFVDLNTGKMTRKVVLPVEGLEYAINEGGYDGRYLFGFLSYDNQYFKDKPSGAVGYLLDLKTKEIKTFPTSGSPHSMFIDRTRTRLFFTGTPSVGWWVDELGTGKRLFNHPNPSPLFIMDVVGIDEDRAGLVQCGSIPGSASVLNVVSISSGKKLAEAVIPDEYGNCAAVTRDGKYVYVGNFKTISKVEIPPMENGAEQ